MIESGVMIAVIVDVVIGVMLRAVVRECVQDSNLPRGTAIASLGQARAVQTSVQILVISTMNNVLTAARLQRGFTATIDIQDPFLLLSQGHSPALADTAHGRVAGVPRTWCRTGGKHGRASKRDAVVGVAEGACGHKI
jgi:hypothetical protein